MKTLIVKCDHEIVVHNVTLSVVAALSRSIWCPDEQRISWWPWLTHMVGQHAHPTEIKIYD